MSLYGRLLGYIGLQRKSASTLDLFNEIFGARLSKSGEAVNWKTALQVSTVLACARVIAEGISQVPLRLYRESPDGKSRLPATDHQLYRVLHRRPNPWQTSFEYRETIALHLVLCGRHYSFINRSGKRILELMPFEPQCVETVVAPDGTLSYKVTLNGVIQKFPAESIWHVKGPSWTGYEGMEAVQLAREAIGLALATESQHAKLHANGVSTTGIYSVDGTLNEAQYKQLRDFIVKNHTGENRGTPLILDRNAKWLSQALSGVDAEHLDTRRFQVEEICRSLRVMPIMVGHADKTATYASAEQMFLAHVVHTLSPWYERIEQSIDVNLLTDADAADGIYSKFVEEGLLRGAMADTADYLVKLTTNGILTRNEARARIDENPLDGLDEPLTPVNLGVGADPVPEPVVAEPKSERLDALELKLASFERQPVSITLNQEPVEMKYTAAPVTVNQAPVTVNTPEVRFPDLQAPVVNNQFDVTLPEQKPAVVNNTFDLNLPEQKAAVVNNVFNVPKQDASPVVLEATLPALALEVTAKLPPRKTKSKTDITRDSSGNIVRSLSESVETDA